MVYIHSIEPPRLSKLFAKCFSYIDSPDSRKLIVKELSEFFKERERCSKCLEEYNHGAKDESEAIAEVFEELTRRQIDEALRMLLDELHSKGIYLTGGQLSALTRYDMPDDIREKLCGLKAYKVAALPEAERLPEQDAAALFAGLRESGFVKCEMSDFLAHFAKEEKYGSPITWTGTPAQLAYFIYSYCRRIMGPRAAINRVSAFCRIFDIEDKVRRNTIQPYLFDFRNGKKKTCRGGKKIDTVFNALQGLNMKAEAR